MKKTLPILALIGSIILSLWLHFSGSKIERLLTSREWQSAVVADVASWSKNVTNIEKVRIDSTVKYLANGTYVKASELKLFLAGSEQPANVSFSETGHWTLNDDYLLVNPIDFKKISTDPNKILTSDDLKRIKELFMISAQLSRRIDVLNEHSIMLTSLTHGSTVLYSH